MYTTTGYTLLSWLKSLPALRSRPSPCAALCSGCALTGSITPSESAAASKTVFSSEAEVMADSAFALVLSSASAASATKDDPIRCCNLSLAATAEAALVVVDAEAFVAFGALRSRPKIFLLLLAAVVLALEETDAAAEEELLEAMAEEELVAEEDEVLRMFL